MCSSTSPFPPWPAYCLPSAREWYVPAVHLFICFSAPIVLVLAVALLDSPLSSLLPACLIVSSRACAAICVSHNKQIDVDEMKQIWAMRKPEALLPVGITVAGMLAADLVVGVAMGLTSSLALNLYHRGGSMPRPSLQYCIRNVRSRMALMYCVAFLSSVMMNSTHD